MGFLISLKYLIHTQEIYMAFHTHLGNVSYPVFVDSIK